jgi:hypothetical protein
MVSPRKRCWGQSADDLPTATVSASLSCLRGNPVHCDFCGLTRQRATHLTPQTFRHALLLGEKARVVGDRALHGEARTNREVHESLAGRPILGWT